MAFKQPVQQREVQHLQAFNNGNPPAETIHDIGGNTMQPIQTAELSVQTPGLNMQDFSIG
jgi:hypothetical protein